VPEANTCTGGCHCGAVRFEATTDLASVYRCNCSLCTKLGVLWSVIPSAQFALRSGEDALTDYQFGRRSIHHLFCRTCGVESFAPGTMPDGTAVVGVNVRCLDGVDPDTLVATLFNGRDL
jgi:hypothetical protein